MTSPSCTTYSFPSSLSFPRFFTSASLPQSTRSSYDIVSALMNPLSKSPWITPAALGAFHPLPIVHALVSVGPDVKYVCRSSMSYASLITRRSPQSSIPTPRDSRNSDLSSSSRSTSSASTWAETRTVDAPSEEACSASLADMSFPPARSASATFAAYIIFFRVSSPSPRTAASSSSSSSAFLAGRLSFSTAATFSSAVPSLESAFRSFFTLSILFSTWARSASASSKLISSASLTGSTLPSTCITLSSSKHRTTCTIASHCRIVARNWFPSPSPSDAPFTSPATSTNSSVVGTTFTLSLISARAARRGSGTSTMPVLGSMVQKG
mmetsp:Transcript_42390/g.90199  ORF Transcript_42390/g.90199 Transcript_42390/m.90199 type:complete len:325 (-) Transcript_42390:540-1514(-)